MNDRHLVMQTTPPDPADQPTDNSPPQGSASRMGLTYRTPVVTLTLIVINVALWLAAAAVGSSSWLQGLWMPDFSTLLLLGAKYGPAIQAGEYWRLVTAMFLHAGFLHLAFNMWALLQLGTLCELLYGRVRFLILYICSGVLGSLASYELTPILGVGASGAIFGLLGVALVYSIKYRRDLPPGMAEQMRRSLTMVLVLNLLITMAIPLIDKAAHLGGLVTGILLASLTESAYAPPARREREGLPTPMALLTVIGLLAYGAWGMSSILPRVRAFQVAESRERRHDREGAVRILQRVITRNPRDTGARQRLCLTLLRAGRWSEATQEFLMLSRTPLPPEEIMGTGMLVAEALSMARQGREAEAVYRRLLELFPEHHQLLNGLAYLYADVLETKLDEAEELVQKALEKVSPEFIVITRMFGADIRGPYLDTLAWVYFKQGKLKEAYTTQQQALQHVSDHPEMRYHMGRIYEARRDLPSARHEYEMALRKNPTYAPARQALEKLNRKTPAPRSVPPMPSEGVRPRGGETPTPEAGGLTPAGR